MERYRTEVTTAFGDRIRWNRTFSGFQLSVPEFMPAFVMSNLLKFVAGHPAGLLDNIRVVNKILVDGFSCDNLTQKHVVACHMNLVFLPQEAGVEMKKLYPTDEEARSRNPAGQQGVSSVTAALYVGRETHPLMKANLVNYDPRF